MSKKIFDLGLASTLLFVLAIPITVIAALVKTTSKGPVIYWSERIGQNNTRFWMPKFRTMKIETPEVATHLLQNSESWLTPIGGFLRKTSLDELPQLLSILKGEMSFVGPRPALHNQNDLILARSELSVDELLPGLTGWAQVNGRDELSIRDKVDLDAYYRKNKSFTLDLFILLKTFYTVLARKDIK